MNKFKSIFLLAILASFVMFSSCKKDEEKDYGSFTYNGTEYSFSGGFLQYWGQSVDTVGHGFDLILYTKGASVTSVTGYHMPTGGGEALTFYVYSTSKDGISSGQYTYTAGWDKMAGTFDWGDIMLDLNSTDYTSFEDGSITVTWANNSYEINFNLIDVNGKALGGNYKGSLTYYDVSDL